MGLSEGLHLPARAPAVLPQAHQFGDLRKRKAQVTSVADEAQCLDFVLLVLPIAGICAPRFGQQTELLQHLNRAGLTVPVPIPTTDGRLFADGLVVMTYVEGGPPETAADWHRVAATLRQLHRLTQGWPQRPGWRSSTDLLHAETGTRIDLGAMPPESVARCRAAWARLVGRQTCVVHGDPNPRNIRMTADRVALIDWDEAHVDVPDLDLVLPHNAADLDDEAHDIAAQAWAAWEAAVCWDDAHAVKRLADVHAV